MSFDTQEEKQTSRLFLAGLLVFIALVGAVFYYFSGRDIEISQKMVEVNIPIPTDTVTQGTINPDTAPPVNPRGMPNFAIPSEDPKPYAPLPAVVSEPDAAKPESTE